MSRVVAGGTHLVVETLEAGDGFGEGADLPHVVHELFRELLKEECFGPALHRAGDDGLESLD